MNSLPALRPEGVAELVAMSAVFSCEYTGQAFADFLLGDKMADQSRNFPTKLGRCLSGRRNLCGCENADIEFFQRMPA